MTPRLSPSAFRTLFFCAASLALPACGDDSASVQGAENSGDARSTADALGAEGAGDVRIGPRDAISVEATDWDSAAGTTDGLSPAAGDAASAVRWPLTFRVYLAPPEAGGNDGSAGTTADAPVMTLHRALEIISAAKPRVNVLVLIAPGVYYGQSVVWTYTDPAHTITFQPWGTGTVVFDGCSSGSTSYAESCADATSDGDGHFFLLGSHPAGDTNLVFERLEIRHYRNGIRFANGASAHNRISNCYFHHIGNGWTTGLTYASLPGYGAVRSTESSYNEFRGNHFAHIENVPGACDVCAGHMHSYYLSKSSDYNTIDGERHEYVSGGPVRFRDYSNHNVVSNSTFIAGGLGKGAVSDYYSPDGGECPCFDMTLSGLKVYGDWDCARSAKVWVPYEAASSCARPALSPRASGSGNCTTTAAPYCSTATQCKASSVP